jgi:hypothetical protein
MAERIIESLTGVGTIYAGGTPLRTTKYELQFWLDESAAGSKPGMRIEGNIDVTGLGEAVVLAGPDALTLQLEDGRRLPFTLTGSTGHIVGSGGIEPPSTQSS